MSVFEDVEAPAESEAEGTRKAKNVERVFEVWNRDDIPKPNRGGVPGKRTSELDELVERVKADYPEGTPEDADVLISRYGNGGNGATSAKVALSKRYPESETGLKFYSRKLDADVKGLFVQYLPDAE